MKETKTMPDKTILFSSIQRGIAFDMERNSYDTTYYISQTILIFHTDLITGLFREAWQHFIDYHVELFSLAIPDKLVLERYATQLHLSLPFSYDDLSLLPRDIQKDRVMESEKSDLNTPFKLNAPPLMRLHLLKLDKKRYQLIWTKHHLLMDGIGTYLTIKTVFHIYQLLINKKSIDNITHTQTVSPHDINHANSADEIAFWKNALVNHQHHGLNFSPANRHRRTDELDIFSEDFLISTELTENIKNYSKKNNISINTLLQGALGMILSTYSNANPVTFGTVRRFPNREQYGIGMYTNTLPMSLSIDPHKNIKDYLASIVRFNKKIRQYASTALSSIRQWSCIPLEQPLFEIIIDYKPASLADMLNCQFPDISFKTALHLKIPYAISFEIVQYKSHCLVMLSYDKNRFTRDYVACIFASYLNVLRCLIDPQYQQIKEIEALDYKTQKHIIVNWNQRNTIGSVYPTFHEHVEAHAKNSPTSIALCYGKQKITYEQLNDRANQLAHFLRRHGINIGSNVAVSLHASIEQYFVLLAILKCGATLVPLDPTYPIERIKAMLTDAMPAALITTTPVYHAVICKVSRKNIPIWKIDQDHNLWAQSKDDNLNLSIAPSRAAYIVFTSGSTGKPKGIIIEHRQWLAMMNGCISRFGVVKKSKILQINPFGFDVFQADWGIALITGATLCLFDNHPFSPEKIVSAIETYQITFIQCASAILISLPKVVLTSLKIISIGGEPCPLATANFWSQGRDFYHVYGISETTIVSTAGKYDKKRKQLTIGQPLPGAKVYILNEQMETCPPYVPGEIFIGGKGVARGYLNHSEEMEYRFIEYKIKFCNKQRLYRTGDIARWLPSGDIEFLHRKDDQVKIRGHRVELTEIEQTIERLTNITIAKVIKDTETDQLLAYVVSSDPGITEIKIRQDLIDHLPTYMIPQHINFIESLPKTATGKIDKAVLKSAVQPEKKSPTVSNHHVPVVLIDQAKILLSAHAINPTSNFFDLGFDSITLSTFQLQIEKFLHIKLNVADLFVYSSIESLANYIDQLNLTSDQANLTDQEKSYEKTE